VAPSIVCEEVVAIVNTEVLELAFLIVYVLPVIPTAVGNVIVDAVVPVKIRLQSAIVAAVAPVKILIPVANDPFTSNVEKGVVVPMPI
jgi:hypothetical protein